MKVKVSKHFTRDEFTCNCRCGFDCVDAQLVNVLENVRFHFSGIYEGVFIKITSGNRCSKHNSMIKGSTPNSQHTKGIACDFTVFYEKNIVVDPQEVADFLEKISGDAWGIGIYNNRIHLDMRSSKARWDMRK
jgi:uncharacterized protein YcbK (DUF882 family)